MMYVIILLKLLLIKIQSLYILYKKYPINDNIDQLFVFYVYSLFNSSYKKFQDNFDFNNKM